MTKSKNNLAVVDLGTNSFHLIVVEIDTKRRIKILGKQKEMVRLGAGPSDMKYIDESAMNRALETLRRFKAIADASDASIRAVATSAVREALNQGEFLRRVKTEIGLDVEIASGFEEARLIYLGVIQALPVAKKRILLVDIGGGSTELVVAQQREILYANSLKLGALRLTQRFFGAAKLDSRSVDQCRNYVAGTLNPASRAIRRLNYEMAIGSSGTILCIAAIIRALRERTASTRSDNISFSRDELFSAVNRIISGEDSEERRKISGLESSRADIIVAGAIILEQVFNELDIETMTVSEAAMREGIVIDTIEKIYKKGTINSPEDMRHANVLHLAEHYGYEKRHAHQVAYLALRIFDQTQHLHNLTDTEREILEAASMLHDIGLFISHSQHHRHSYYLIRHSELLGFTENEKEIIANVARYHRKSHPKLKHDNFNKLNPEEQQIVTCLASILRMADGLDRTHASAIRDIICKTSKDSVLFILDSVDSSPAALEIWAAESKKALFEETFSLPVKFRPVIVDVRNYSTI